MLMCMQGQVCLQGPASINMVYMCVLHDHAMLIVTLILCFVLGAMLAIMGSSFSARYGVEAPMIELVWTVVPMGILMCLASPSMQFLYVLEEVCKPFITVKVTGFQWYWGYEISEWGRRVKFTSKMIGTSLLSVGQYRLLEVDKRLVVPASKEVRVLVTSADVIHSWTVPSLAVKVDAVPGRLNQAGFFCRQVGVFFGQCSEICGANHSFMPIGLEVLGLFQWWEWFDTASMKIL